MELLFVIFTLFEVIVKIRTVSYTSFRCKYVIANSEQVVWVIAM